MSGFSPEVRESLLKAGWTPGRRVDTVRWTSGFTAAGLPPHAAAVEFLAEFGGLSFSPVDDWSLGSRFEFDPLLCIGEEDRFHEWSADLGSRLFPLGEFDGGRYFLGIDEERTVYLVETWLASFGRGPQAVENLIRRVPPENVL
ncbi:SUKH-3 domain-containing protein [Lentzea sp. NPDC059081]|uniref:SUKH-3 domain-containing protein n=1 Tax=Lentzea sp. NPDC059081 TaxID=3346719 RepID=UPI00369D4866